MKEINLGTTKGHVFQEFLIVSLSNKWLFVNKGKPLQFEAKLTKNGKLELSASLAALDSSKEVSKNEM